MKLAKVALVYGFFLLAGMALMMEAAPAPTVRIGGSSLRANGQVAQGFQYTGSCPVALKFGWSLQTTEPAIAYYSFSRSDGGRPRGGSIDLTPGRSGFVYLDWNLGANNPRFADFHGFAVLNVESPNHVSQKIDFTLHCGG